MGAVDAVAGRRRLRLLDNRTRRTDSDMHMHRRHFATTLLGAGAALVLPRPLLALSRHVSATRGLTSAAPIINGVRLNARLA